MAPAILVVIALPAPLRDGLLPHYRLHAFPGGPGAVEWSDELADVEGVVTNGSYGFTADAMDRLPQLKVICSMGAGYENIDVAAATSRGIWVTHAPGTNAATVAEHALGFALALARGYRPLAKGLAQGEWASLRTERPSINGSTVGIIGMGTIGSMIAARASACGARIAYHGPSAKPAAAGQYYPDLMQLARDSDFLIAACPGGPATRHLLNKKTFDALGPEGFVINVARGSVLDTGDLLDALKNGRIAGAGLDVLEEEPTPPAALLRELVSMDNVLVTPHLSGRSPAAFVAQRDVMLQSLAQGLAGQKPTLQVPLPA
jgi:D-3-phosphoglycerate dehydrogenase